MPDFMTIDFETRSFVDLTSKSTNAWIYAEHESADILCMAYKINDGPAISWRPGASLPDEFINFKGFLIAHNVLFEYAITANIGVKKYGFPEAMLKIDRWICTAAMCRCNAIPAHLSDAVKYLKLKSQKLDVGTRLIAQYSIPVVDRSTGHKSFNELFSGMFDDDADAMMEYNRADVDATWELFNKLKGAKNTAFERKIFLHDVTVNTRGMRIDLNALEVLKSAIEKTEKRADEDQKRMGINFASGPQLIQYLRQHGIVVENAQEKTLAKARQSTLNKDVIMAFELREFLAKVSLKKVFALDGLLSPDSKLRYFLKYFGARTGRYSGRGFQPHNMPKDKEHDKKRSYEDELMEAIGRLQEYPDNYRYAQVIKDIKKYIPALIIPDPGHIFLIGDFAAIEARVLAWIAGEKKLVEAFRAGKEIYKDMAATIYHTTPDRVTDLQRALGKGVILGCGYSMGPTKFHATCLSQGVDVSPELASKAVKTYRETYPMIPKYWYNVEDYFKKRIGPRVSYTLPSGRELIYRNVRIEDGQLMYEDTTEKHDVKLYGGIITENICQALARDILCDRMLECEKEGLPVVFHTHDEIVCQVPIIEGEEKSAEFNKIMNTAPTWLEGFPLKTEIEICRRYHK